MKVPLGTILLLTLCVGTSFALNLKKEKRTGCNYTRFNLIDSFDQVFSADGIQAYICRNQTVNKYGRKVAVWFIADKNGTQQSKRVYESGRRYSLHGVWPKDRCFCKYQCPLVGNDANLNEGHGVMTELGSATVLAVRQEMNDLQNIIEKEPGCFVEYVSAANSLMKSLGHEYKKHYLNNGLTLKSFLKDFSGNLRIEGKPLWPHSCRYSKKDGVNIIQQVYSDDIFNDQNYKQSCVGSIFSFDGTSEKFHLTDFPLYYTVKGYASENYYMRLEHEEILMRINNLDAVENDTECILCSKDKVKKFWNGFVKNKTVNNDYTQIKEFFEKFGYAVVQWARNQDLILPAVARKTWRWLAENLLFLISFLAHCMALVMAIFASMIKKIKKTSQKYNWTVKKQSFIDVLYSTRFFYLIIVSCMMMALYLYHAVEWMSVVFAALCGIWTLSNNTKMLIKNSKIVSLLVLGMQVLIFWVVYDEYYLNLANSEEQLKSRHFFSIDPSDKLIIKESAYNSQNLTNLSVVELSYLSKNLAEVGRFKDAQFIGDYLVNYKNGTFKLEMLNSLNDMYIIPLTMVLFFVFYLMRTLVNWHKRRVQHEEVVRNEGIDAEVIEKHKVFESVAFSFLVDFVFLLAFITLSCTLVGSAGIDERFVMMRKVSMDNVFRMCTLVAVFCMTVDNFIALIPWSRRNYHILEGVIVFMAMCYKLDEMYIFGQESVMLFERIYFGMQFDAFVASMIATYTFVIAFKQHYRYVSIWIIMVEIACLVPTVKFAMQIDTVFKHIGMIQVYSRNWGYEMTEGLQAVVVAFIVALTVNMDFMVRPKNIFWVMDTGKLMRKVSVSKHLSYMFTVFMRVMYVTAFFAIMINLLHATKSPPMITSVYLQGFFIATNLAIVFLAVMFIWANYDKIRRMEFDHMDRGKYSVMRFMLLVILMAAIIAFVSLIALIGMTATGFVKQVMFGREIAPFITLVLIFEYLFSFIGSTVESFRTVFSGDGPLSEALLKWFDQMCTFIKFIFSSFKLISYFRILVQIFVLISNTVERGQSHIDFFVSVVQLPIVIFYLCCLIDLVVGLHTRVWNWFIGDKEIYRYEKYERNGNYRNILDNVEQLQHEWDENQENLEFNNIPQINGLHQTKMSNNGQRNSISVQGKARFNPGEDGNQEPLDVENYTFDDNLDHLAEQEELQEAALDPIQEEDEDNLDHLAEDEVDEELAHLAEPEPNVVRNRRERDNRPNLTIKRDFETQSTEEVFKPRVQMRSQNVFANGVYIMEMDFVHRPNEFCYSGPNIKVVNKGECVVDKETFDQDPIYKARSIYAPIASFVQNKVMLKNLSSLCGIINENDVDKVLKVSEAIERNKKSADAVFNKLSEVHTLWVKSELNEIRDAIMDTSGWPHLTMGLVGKMVSNIAGNINFFAAAQTMIPKVVLATMNSEIKSIFSPETIDKDEVVTLDEYMMCTNESWSDFYNNIKQKKNYLLTTKTGKCFVTTSEISCTMMLNGGGPYISEAQKFRLFECRKTEDTKSIRPYRIEESIMHCSVNNCFGAKIDLPKGTNYLECVGFGIVICSRTNLNKVVIRNSSLANYDQKWMLGALALSVGVVFDHDPVRANHLRTNMHHGSCTTVRIDGDTDNLYILTNKHVAEDFFYGKEKKFLSQYGNHEKKLKIKEDLHAVFTICGKFVVVKLDDLVAFGDDYALFLIPRQVKKQMLSYFQEINCRNPILCFPKMRNLAAVSGCYMSMSRQLDRTLSVSFNKIRQFQTYIMWNNQTKVFDVWGYTVPGMSGSPIFNITGTEIQLIGLNSAVENNRFHMVHSTRIISADKIRQHCSQFDLKKPGTFTKIFDTDNCEFPCETSRMDRINKKVDEIRHCQGTLNTMELDSLLCGSEWPEQMNAPNFILCDSENPKAEVVKQMLKRSYDKVMMSLENNVSPTLMPGIFVEELCKISKETKDLDLENKYDISKVRVSFSDITVMINKLKVGSLKIGRKEYNGLSWQSKHDMSKFSVSKLVTGTWSVKIKSEFDEKPCEIILDDAALVELILASEILDSQVYDALVKDLSRMSRVGKIYTAFFDGKSIVLKEIESSEKSCDLEEVVDIYILADGERFVEITEAEMKELQKGNPIDEIKWLLKKLENAQNMKLEIDKKIEIAKSKIKDLTSSVNYQKKQAEYQKAYGEYMDKKKKYLENKKESEEALREYRNEIARIEQRYLRKIQDKICEKQRLSEQGNDAQLKLKERKARISEKYTKQIEQIQEKIKSYNEKIKDLTDEKNSALSKIQNESYLNKIKQNVISLNEQISKLQIEKEEEKNKIKNEIKKLQGPVPEPIKIPNPAVSDEMKNLTSELFQMKNLARENVKEQTEIQQKITDMKVKLNETSKRCRVSLCTPEIMDNSNVSYTDLVKIIMDMVNKFIDLYNENKVNELENGSITDRLLKLEKENALLKKKNNQLEQMLNEKLEQCTITKAAYTIPEDMAKHLKRLEEKIEDLAKNRTLKKKLENKKEIDYEEIHDDSEEVVTPKPDLKRFNRKPTVHFDEVKNRTQKQKREREQHHEDLNEVPEQNEEVGTPMEKRKPYSKKPTYSAVLEQDAKNRTKKQQRERQKEHEDVNEMRDNSEDVYTPQKDRQPYSRKPTSMHFEVQAKRLPMKEVSLEDLLEVIKKKIEEFKQKGQKMNRLPRLMEQIGGWTKGSRPDENSLVVAGNDFAYSSKGPKNADDLVNFLNVVGDLENSNVTSDEIMECVEKFYSGKGAVKKPAPYVNFSIMKKNSKSPGFRATMIFVEKGDIKKIEECLDELEERVEKKTGRRVELTYVVHGSEMNMTNVNKKIVSDIIPKFIERYEYQGRNNYWRAQNVEEMMKKYDVVYVAEPQHMDRLVETEEQQNFLYLTRREMMSQRLKR